MDFFPVFLKLQDQPCLVVGGGEVAARKAEALLRAGARVTVVAPETAEALAALIEQGRVTYHAGVFEPEQVEGQRVVVAATDNDTVNAEISRICRERNILVNAVDAPELCTYITPAIVDRSPLLIAISSGGDAPVLARLWRARLEGMIPAAYGRLAALAGRMRSRVKTALPSFERRLRFWEQVFDGPVATHMLAGRNERAAQALEEALTQAADEAGQPLTGEVYLVGAGPGDPDLLTFRALRLMQRADVVLYDRLISPGVLELVRKDAERIYVGKASRNHTLRQEGINALLVKLAKEGKRVVRLKGGDPFIFGRGGEEIASLADERIPFEVVPGITAASGCATYAGIPLTHRDYAQSCQFVTGHPAKSGEIDLDWVSLARRGQTVVFYMGLAGLPVLCRKLLENGLPDDWPAALIQQGTTAAQKVWTGTLATLPGIAEHEEVRAPSLVIVGEVVQLHQKLEWFHGDPATATVFDVQKQ